MDSNLHIVIPVHNRKAFTRDCLLSLQTQTAHHHTIIVDDGSTDGTDEMLKREFPDVTTLTGDGNLFWTAAVNMGIRHALSNGAQRVMTLNNDTMASSDFLEKMMYWSQKKPEALLGALDIDSVSRNPYYGGEVVNRLWNTSHFLLDELPPQDRKGLHEVSFLPGRGLLIPRLVFDCIGLFDEKMLPHYMADYDFTARALSYGFDLYCNYDAKLYTYPEEGGDPKIRRSKTIRNYFNHLFSIRGGGNLKNFTIYTLRHSPVMLIPLHLMKGYAQRLFGYFLH